MEEEAVRLTALPAQRQPNIQRLGIATVAPQNLSALFRRVQLTRVEAN